VRSAPCHAMVRLALVALTPLAGIAFAGCGSQGDSTPVACLEGAAAYEKALQGAPGEVRLDDGTPISDCLASNQQAGDLAQAGEALVDTATALNAQAREQGGGKAAVELGYLIGAAQRGAADSEGIHSDLLRRLVVAARYAPGKQPLPPVFFRTYEAGYAAGRRAG
jgi:hypothetical protein